MFVGRWPVQYHLIAKDILRFHAVYWPAMLMAAGLPLPETVFAHGYLLVGGEKMSKTSLNHIAPADLVPEFGSDGFRYHFVTDLHFGQDGDFSYEGMVAALQRRPRQQLRQPREPRAEHGGVATAAASCPTHAPTARSPRRPRPRSTRWRRRSPTSRSTTRSARCGS